MKKYLLVFVAFVSVMVVMPKAVAQTSPCDTISLPYFEDFYSDNGTLPDCWVYNGSYVGWNNWPETSGNGELMFKASSGSQPAVLPNFVNGGLSKYEITFKTKCGTIAEGDGILIGVADAAGNLLQWLDTIQDPNFSRNAWVWVTYNFLAYSGNGVRIALGRLWNTYDGSKWVAIDDVNVRQLPNCYPVENLQASGLIDPDGISFSWSFTYEPDLWQVYLDTVGVNIDDVDTADLIEITEPYYAVPEGTLQGGGKYVFYARGVCINQDNSEWASMEFGAGTVVMNNTGVADVLTGCGFVVYDNGGPIAGYLDNSNSMLTIYADGTGNQLRVDGGIFGIGASGATLSIYDGTSATGTALFTYNTTNGRDTMTNVLATSTQGALTFKFNSYGNMSHTGYELYVHCTQAPSCARPTAVEVAMASANSATVTWTGTAPSYIVSHRMVGTPTWTTQTVTANSATLSNLTVGAEYETHVQSVCGTNDMSVPSVTVNFVADINCPPVSGLAATNITDNSAVLRWDSDGSEWEVEFDGNTFTTTNNPYTITGLHANYYYSYKVRTVCELGNSAWSSYYSFQTTNTGIEDVETAAGLNLYPNPATGEVSVKIVEAAEVSIVDIDGRVCGTWRLASGSSTIDISALTPGTYMVQAVSARGTSVQRLIVR